MIVSIFANKPWPQWRGIVAVSGTYAKDMHHDQTPLADHRNRSKQSKPACLAVAAQRQNKAGRFQAYSNPCGTTPQGECGAVTGNPILLGYRRRTAAQFGPKSGRAKGSTGKLLLLLRFKDAGSRRKWRNAATFCWFCTELKNNAAFTPCSLMMV